MRKFAFLLAIVAVFAMSAVAWGDANNKLEIGNYNGPDPINNDDITSNAADAFYFGEMPTKLTVGFNVTVGDSTDGVETVDTVVGYKLNGGALVRTATNITQSGSDQFKGDLALDLALANGVIALTDVGSYAAGDDTAKGVADWLTVTARAVTLTAKDGGGTGTDQNGKTIVIKTGSTTPIEIKVAGEVADSSVTVDEKKLVAKSGDKTVTTEEEIRKGIKVKYENATLTVTPSAAAVAGDPFTIGLYSPEINGAQILGTSTASVAGIADDAKLMEVTFSVVDYIITPASASWDGNATPPSSVTFTVKDLTADKLSKIEIKASGVGSDVLDPANYTATTNGSDVDIELKLEYLEGLSKNDYTFTITDDSSKTASFALSVTPKAEASYAADPSSATWDGTSGVKFKVDMPHSDFNAIGVKSPNDEDVRELGKDYYTVTPTADGIEVELKAEYLLSLTETGDYVYYVGDLKGRPALFTLTVAGKYNVPDVGVEPSFESGEAPEGVQFGISQRIMDRSGIVTLEPKIGDFLDGDGMIKKDEAARLTRTDQEALTVLPIIAATLSEDKTVAAFTFGVTGRALVSEGTSGIKWYDAIIHKMYVGSTAPASVTLAPAPTWGAVANGTFMILDVYGAPLPEDHLIEREGTTQYKLVVYVEDNSDYDLDKTNPKTVADPVAIQASSGGRSKSSSGCDAGVFAPLAALACLAALGLVKRRAR